jgi:oligoendopeptidase F
VPLIFLNHQDTFDSVSTYTHEWGHGMHTLQANGAQPFETAGYPLFLAEIAAFTHELLLADHMQKTAKTREERIFYLGILRSGGSRHPVPLLKDAGLDMDSPRPHQALARHMERLMDELEALLPANPA